MLLQNTMLDLVSVFVCQRAILTLLTVEGEPCDSEGTVEAF